MNHILINKLAVDCYCPPGTGTFESTFDCAKFAERIVRECAKVLRDSSYKHSHTDYYDGFNEALNYSAFRIEELFGIDNETDE